MIGSEILTMLHAVGITYRLDRGEIVLTPADRVTPEIKAAILANRAAVVEAINGPTWCTGWRCIQYEEIPTGRGPLPGCLINGRARDPWRPLHRLTGCPLDYEGNA